MVVPPFLTCGRSGKAKDKEEEEEEEEHDNLVWLEDRKEDDYHCSIAMSQSNSVMEDFWQVEFGKNLLFVGVYDGHNGPEAANFISVRLFRELRRLVTENKNISEDIMSQAVESIEEEFMNHVKSEIDKEEKVGSVGSCCLFGIIWGGTLFVANLGDSRAILGSKGFLKRPHVVQLTVDHNVSHAAAREEIQAHNTSDSLVLCMNRGSLRVKSKIEITRSVGDAYLKWSPISKESHPNFEPVPNYTKGVLSATPYTHKRDIKESDKFLIFASHGFWKLMTNLEAAYIVYNNSPDGISKRLVRAALEKVTNDIITYETLQNLDAGNGLQGRRHYYDDVTVIVIFLNKRLAKRRDTPVMEPEFQPEFQSTTSRNVLKDLEACSSVSNSNLQIALKTIDRILDDQTIPVNFQDEVQFLQVSLLEQLRGEDDTFKDLAIKVGEILYRIKMAQELYDLADKNLKNPKSGYLVDIHVEELNRWEKDLEKAKSDWKSIKKLIDEAGSSERETVSEITREDPHETQPSLDPKQGETSNETRPDKDSDGSQKSKETTVKKKLGDIKGKCCIPFNQL